MREKRVRNMGLFRRKPSPIKIAGAFPSLASGAIGASRRILEVIQEFEREETEHGPAIDDAIILLTAVLDHLAFTKFGDPVRDEIMIRIVENTLGYLDHRRDRGVTGQTDAAVDSTTYFETRFLYFGSSSCIMDGGADSLVSTGARYFVGAYLPDLSAWERADATTKMENAVSSYITALLTMPEMKVFLEP